MPPLSLSVEFSPRSEPCEAVTQCMPGESWIVSDFGYPEARITPGTLSETIDQSYRLHRDGYVIFIGEADISLEKQFSQWPYRISDIQIYSNPVVWGGEQFEPVPERLDPEFIVYELVADDYHARVRTPMSVHYDLDRKEIAFRFGDGAHVATWHRIADTVVVGEDAEHQLAEMRFEAVTGLEGIEVAASKWRDQQASLVSRFVKSIKRLMAR